jgi:LysM repeat protein
MSPSHLRAAWERVAAKGPLFHRARASTPTRRVWWFALVLLVVLLTSAGGVIAAPVAQGGDYVVRSGDTLGNIAARFGVSISTLARANGISNPDRIYVGQKLAIPGQSASASPAKPAVPATTSGVHVVRSGETLAIIAARYGVSVSALAKANGLANINVIYVGQRLAIPGSSSAVAQPAPAAKPVAASAGRWIDINLSQQRLIAYQGNKAVFSTLISSGTAAHPTATGRFAIRTKIRAQRMTGPGYNLPNVPYVMYFYGANAIHGTYWHNNFGHPMSHGCINLRTGDAAWLYSWASIGTPVVVHY